VAGMSNVNQDSEQNPWTDIVGVSTSIGNRAGGKQLSHQGTRSCKEGYTDGVGRMGTDKRS